MDEERNPERAEETPDKEEELLCRRDFLLGLKKWSKVAIAAALTGGALAATSREAEAGWINRFGGGGSWINGHGGGGWINRFGGGGGSWINR